MIVITHPGTIHFEIRGKRIDEMLTQEMVDLARELALHPKLVKRLDVDTMTLRDKEVRHGKKG